MIPVLLIINDLLMILLRQWLQQMTLHRTYDVVIVLGCPADEDGKPTPTMRTRVTAAVEAFRRVGAKYLICSGGSVRNAYNEADAMATFALELGIDSHRLIRERKSINTYENIKNSVAIMRAHNWSAALVVTSPWHIRRAKALLHNYPIRFHMFSSHFAKGIKFHRIIQLILREIIKRIGMRLRGQ
jgi:uncharacterized SAM-binding protein YcdF (DUF218 family)